jgi:acetyl esterase/lipase
MPARVELPSQRRTRITMNRAIYLSVAGFLAAWSLVTFAQPGPAASPELPPPQAHVYRESEGKSLHAYVFSRQRPGASPVPAVLLFHGGGWIAGKADWVFRTAAFFAQQDMVAISIDYRLSGSGMSLANDSGRGSQASHDNRPEMNSVSPVEQLSDACEAFRWARANAAVLGIEPSHIAGYGESAGGHLVAAAATVGCGTQGGSFQNGGPDALLLLSPAVDAASDRLFARLMQGRGDVRAYSPLHQVMRTIAPTIIFQGDRDTVTPLAGARSFCEQVVLHKGRCDLNVYPGVGHVLTRNLDGNQNLNIDRDPVAVKASNDSAVNFLRGLWPRSGS